MSVETSKTLDTALDLATTGTHGGNLNGEAVKLLQGWLLDPSNDKHLDRPRVARAVQQHYEARPGGQAMAMDNVFVAPGIRPGLSADSPAHNSLLAKAR
jgi:hypothetical protein